MKKIFYLILFIFIPLNVFADEIDYDITNYYINANILENGNMDVSELIVLDGTFNGYEREISYKNSKLTYSNPVNLEHDAIYNANGISNYSAYAKRVNSVSFDTFNENFDELNIVENINNAKNRDVYIKDGYNSKIFRMYYRTDNNKTAFLIRYTVDSAVVMHNDIAELYWQFIGNEYTDVIKDLKIRVNLPQTDGSNYFRFWAHGNLKGDITSHNNMYVLAKIDKLNSKEELDVRMTFNKNLIINDENLEKTNINAFDNIIKVEMKRADEANRIRRRHRIIYNIVRILTIISIIYQLLSIIYIYIKFDREYKSDFISDYNREFIEDYPVEVVDYIMNKNISPNAMSASIMNLIYKKNISAKKIEENKKEEYSFELISEKKLTDEEKRLIYFLFKRVGNGNEFTTIELKDYAKSTSTYKKFTNSYEKWKNSVYSLGKKLNIFESHSGLVAYTVIYMLVCIFLSYIILHFGYFSPIFLINSFLSISIFIYSLTFNKRTKYGNDQYVRLKGLKKFLEDFGTFDTKELPEITLWERYMVYATVFGIAKRVSKAMNVKIQEMNLSDSTFTFSDYYFYNSLASSINSSIVSAINLANTTNASEIAKSSSSSGSGFGGGFSSGGGFGGGGGGGHGF